MSIPVTGKHAVISSILKTKDLYIVLPLCVLPISLVPFLAKFLERLVFCLFG
jgi:hypothetical protein